MRNSDVLVIMWLSFGRAAGNYSTLLLYFVLAGIVSSSYEHHYSGLSDFMSEFCNGNYNYSLVVGFSTQGIERE